MNNEQLRQFIDRIERLENEKRDIAEDIKSIYSEAKSDGWDTKAMKECIRISRRDGHEIAEEEAILQSYREALNI